jgi:hypothetical protein
VPPGTISLLTETAPFAAETEVADLGRNLDLATMDHLISHLLEVAMFIQICISLLEVDTLSMALVACAPLLG